jgi:Rrf2 family transcriptional regulator, iron-sulfur cluster assembly transcription factor
MIFSRSADYGLRALVHLASQPPNQPVPLDRIAQAQRVPAALLSKILQTLVKAEMLRSQRGYGGGFVLAVDPAALTLQQVVEAIDGPLCVFECLDDEDFCVQCGTCKLRGAFREVHVAMVRVLRSRTVADCLPDVPAPARPLPVTAS